MISKNQISPWNDTPHHDFHRQFKSTLFYSQQAKQKQIKLLKLNKHFASEGQIKNLKEKKILPRSTELKKHSAIELNKNEQSSPSNPQIKIKRLQRHASNNLSIKEPEQQRHSISQRSKAFLKHSISSNENISALKKQSLQAIPINHRENLTYFFSLCQKQKIKWHQVHKSFEQSYDEDEIFRTVEEMSKKRKKQIRLPKISVAYSAQKKLKDSK